MATKKTCMSNEHVVNSNVCINGMGKAYVKYLYSFAFDSSAQPDNSVVVLFAACDTPVHVLGCLLLLVFQSSNAPIYNPPWVLLCSLLPLKPASHAPI